MLLPLLEKIAKVVGGKPTMPTGGTIAWEDAGICPFSYCSDMDPK